MSDNFGNCGDEAPPYSSPRLNVRQLAWERYCFCYCKLLLFVLFVKCRDGDLTVSFRPWLRVMRRWFCVSIPCGCACSPLHVTRGQTFMPNTRVCTRATVVKVCAFGRTPLHMHLYWVLRKPNRQNCTNCTNCASQSKRWKMLLFSVTTWRLQMFSHKPYPFPITARLRWKTVWDCSWCLDVRLWNDRQD